MKPALSLSRSVIRLTYAAPAAQRRAISALIWLSFSAATARIQNSLT